jgi:hypothetical protein
MTKTVTYKGKTYDIKIDIRRRDIILDCSELSYSISPHTMDEFLSSVRSLIEDVESALKFKSDLETWDGTVPDVPEELPF